MIGTNINSLISIEDKDFKFWEQADKYVVERIFNFSNMFLGKNLSEVLGYVYENTSIKDNKYIKRMNIRVDNHLEMMRSIIDEYLTSDLSRLEIGNEIEGSEKKELMQAHQFMYLLLSHSAIEIFTALKNQNAYKAFENIHLSQNEIAHVVARKQRDYGPNNISKFGVFGLVVRVHDKIARLENLLSPKRNGVNSVQGETVFDTLLDIIGYSTVAIMWINNWFLLEMESDS
jgi:hypothetical protein